MQNLNLELKPQAKCDLPVRAIQFGEGNFLRGFLDWMLYKLNNQNLFNGRVIAVQPTPRGRVQPKLLNLGLSLHYYFAWHKRWQRS